MNTKCPWCESENTKLYLKLKDEFLTKENFEIHECTNCGLLYTLPKPNKEHIGAYYQSENYYSHQENKSGFIPKVYEIVKSINLKNKYKMATKGMRAGKVLDIGCGVGDFLNTMEQHGWQASGIEPSEEAIVIARKRTKAQIQAPEEIGNIESESFDLITMWHVLEHVDDLRKEVYELHRLLKKGGRLVLALPNYKSADAQHYREFWAAFDVPRHLNHFSQKTISNIFSTSNLNLIETNKLIWDAYYISYMSEQYKGNSLALLKGIVQGFASNLKARKSGEWSSLVYIFEKK